MGTERAAQIAEMESMGFERSQIEAAMRAAFYNGERAIEYLINVSGPRSILSLETHKFIYRASQRNCNVSKEPLLQLPHLKIPLLQETKAARKQALTFLRLQLLLEVLGVWVEVM
jgi:hypothetical protein